jgi:hypothetical protein
MLFKRMEQTTYGLIHEEDDENFALNIFHLLNIYFNKRGFKRYPIKGN